MYYHGTVSGLLPRLMREGLSGQGRNSLFVTDSLEAAWQYARERARAQGGRPVVLELSLPEMGRQPNGSPAPPFFQDTWHRDSGMPGEGWEYDAGVLPQQLRVLED